MNEILTILYYKNILDIEKYVARQDGKKENSIELNTK